VCVLQACITGILFYLCGIMIIIYRDNPDKSPTRRGPSIPSSVRGACHALIWLSQKMGAGWSLARPCCHGHVLSQRTRTRFCTCTSWAVAWGRTWELFERDDRMISSIKADESDSNYPIRAPCPRPSRLYHDLIYQVLQCNYNATIMTIVVMRAQRGLNVGRARLDNKDFLVGDGRTRSSA
jgi:hypothetical protein